jgi:dolichol-phosphate mannosyltransferase
MNAIASEVENTRREPPVPVSSPCLTRLAIVVPCFNEAEAIDNLIAGLQRLSSSAANSHILEFVLVDDGSTDATWMLLKTHFATREDTKLVRHETNRGIAASIATGVSNTDAPLIASVDADCTYDPSLIIPMAELLTCDVDMVVASPYHPDGCVEGVPAWRLQLSQCASSLYRVLLTNKLHTYTSCFRVYRREAIADICLKNSGFVGIVELLCAVDSRGGRIVEYPAKLSVRQFGQSKMRITRTSLGHLNFLFRTAMLRVANRKPGLLPDN